MKRRVVVTGLGLVTPLGNTVDTTWYNLLNGVSGIDYINYFDTTNYKVKIAAQVKDFVPEEHMPANRVRRYDYYQHYIIASSKEAIACSGIDINDENGHKSSVLIGSSTGGLQSFVENIDLINETGNPRKITPFAIPILVVNGGSNVVAIMTGARGPSSPPVSACATGADCIGRAFHLIRNGRIDRALAGCGDFPILPLGIAAFDRVRALSRNNDNPRQASRPFDKNRDGFVFSEGSGVLVLEELENAKARGAPILAELVGYASTTDAFHRTAPDPNGRGAVEAMQLALEDARVNPDDVQYINAHGTSTPLNDPVETDAIKQVFGDHAYEMAISATKSMTGHAMGTTAAMEAAFTALSIRDQVAPPTMNLHHPDPECDLDYVPNEARDMSVDCAISNSFGFGGHNAVLVFKRFYG
jgi:3-oxoacyl-[acyl-carrier-protein] synthase II